MANGSSLNPTPSPLSVTFNVWRALFLREAITRLATRRAAWMWLLLEPAAHMSIMMFIFTVIRVRVVSGMPSPVWLLVGLLAMFMFMRTGSQSKVAINVNKSLFAYRQVKPVDTVLARAYLEAFLAIIIALLMYGCTFLLGFGLYPNNPLLLISAFFGLWLTGLGYGLITSVIGELLPELDKILKLAMGPIYMVSGVVFPIGNIPSPYQEWLLYNPIAHAIEASRVSISPFYHPFNGLNLPYTFGVALTMIFLGLALHKRYAVQLVMK